MGFITVGSRVDSSRLYPKEEIVQGTVTQVITDACYERSDMIWVRWDNSNISSMHYRKQLKEVE